MTGLTPAIIDAMLSAGASAEVIAAAAKADICAREKLSSVMTSPTGERRLLADIIKRVAEEHGLATDELLGQSRAHHIAHARQQVMWEARQTTRLSLPAIGRRLGGRDHTTVLWGVRRHAARIAGEGA